MVCLGVTFAEVEYGVVWVGLDISLSTTDAEEGKEQRAATYPAVPFQVLSVSIRMSEELGLLASFSYSIFPFTC